MLLKPNMNWKANQGITLPAVVANVTRTDEFIQVDFTVEEPEDCFRACVEKDADHSFEDSCVEIFIENPNNPSEYYNFETTCRGYLLAAHGTGRENRTLLNDADMSKVIRVKKPVSVIGNFITWGMQISIPAQIFGLSSFKDATIRGNLYKCADKAKTPHYLSAFPVDTEKPDFHRPEFFENLAL